jgi:hypothetical protein
VDDHQRRLLDQMLSELDGHEGGTIDLGRLVENLMGLVRAADLQDQQAREDFYDQWIELDREHELRTAPWAPPNSSRDEVLAAALGGVRSWVEQMLGGDDTERQ